MIDISSQISSVRSERLGKWLAFELSLLSRIQSAVKANNSSDQIGLPGIAAMSAFLPEFTGEASDLFGCRTYATTGVTQVLRSEYFIGNKARLKRTITQKVALSQQGVAGLALLALWEFGKEKLDDRVVLSALDKLVMTNEIRRDLVNSFKFAPTWLMKRVLKTYPKLPFLVDGSELACGNHLKSKKMIQIAEFIPALRNHTENMSSIARKVGVSREYVRQVAIRHFGINGALLYEDGRRLDEEFQAERHRIAQFDADSMRHHMFMQRCGMPEKEVIEKLGQNWQKEFARYRIKRLNSIRCYGKSSWNMNFSDWIDVWSDNQIERGCLLRIDANKKYEPGNLCIKGIHDAAAYRNPVGQK